MHFFFSYKKWSERFNKVNNIDQKLIENRTFERAFFELFSSLSGETRKTTDELRFVTIKNRCRGYR